MQQPGQTFDVHVHLDSEEAFIAFQGVGQLYMYDQWNDVEPGDVLFAPPGIPHGARKAATAGTRPSSSPAAVRPPSTPPCTAPRACPRT
ncbi:cupin domain-containing protein [Streptomyces sp. DG1A-41]|uniref:cupin domain-containing protein n=1 Tax=Streptomyces sp. DG1A-41 TaxID=3125779 RepID=UPI0030D33368